MKPISLVLSFLTMAAISQQTLAQALNTSGKELINRYLQPVTGFPVDYNELEGFVPESREDCRILSQKTHQGLELSIITNSSRLSVVISDFDAVAVSRSREKSIFMGKNQRVESWVYQISLRRYEDISDIDLELVTQGIRFACNFRE